MIDLHAHILPGLDDGVATLEEARELARRAAGEGVTAIAATPHVRDDYPTSAAQMQQALAQVRDDFASEQIAVDVLPGAELVERGHAHLLASDKHGPSIRESGLPEAASAVGNKRLARESLPERPRRGWFGR